MRVDADSNVKLLLHQVAHPVFRHGVNLNRWIAAMKLPQQPPQRQLRKQQRRGNAQAARRGCRIFARGTGRLIDFPHRSGGARQQLLARRGEPQPVAAALGQAHAQRRFQLSQPARQRRLRPAAGAAGRPDAAAGGNQMKIFQRIDIHSASHKWNSLS